MIKFFRRSTEKRKKEVEEQALEIVREFFKEELKIRVPERRHIPKLVGFKEVETYPLYDPWAWARIFQNPDTNETIYWVDEIPLTESEKKIYKRIMEILYWELKPPTSGEEGLEYFKEEAKRIAMEYRIRFGKTPGVSWSKILYYVERDVIGYGPIDPLMRDKYIEDISCNGVGKPIYVWHRRYEYIPTNIVFNSEKELDSLVVRLAHKAGKHISVAFPVVDAILPGGHRLAATFRKEVSTSGSTFTIRKFREDPITIIDMIEWHNLSPELAAYLWLLIEHKKTGLILGVTGSGKTSTLNALATLFRPTVKVVTIEDTPELRLPLENWVQLVARPSYGVGPQKIGEITLYDLVKVSLRYRPDVIIVGEVRGEEAYVLFQAIATGHGGLTTLHAEYIDAAVKRLTSPPMNIPKSYISLLDFALVIRRVTMFRPDGTYYIARKVSEVWEVKDYNNYITISKWDPSKDVFHLYLDRSEVLKEIAEFRGKDFDWATDEVYKRAIVLEWMRAKGIRYYKDIASVVHKYYAKPDEVYKRALTELEKLRGAGIG